MENDKQNYDEYILQITTHLLTKKNTAYKYVFSFIDNMHTSMIKTM